MIHSKGMGRPPAKQLGVGKGHLMKVCEEFQVVLNTSVWLYVTFIRKLDFVRRNSDKERGPYVLEGPLCVCMCVCFGTPRSRGR